MLSQTFKHLYHAGADQRNVSGFGKLSGRTYTYADLKAQMRQCEQPLDGFEGHYGSLVDYILRCTFRIWEEKNVGLIRTHYGRRCDIYTPSGLYKSAEEVVEATVKTLNGFPDRQLYSLNVIWDGNQAEGYLSSHLIRSVATNTGTGEFGPPTNKTVDVYTIADCLCQKNMIIREWLVRDNGDYVRQLGLDLEEVAAVRAEKQAANNHTFWFENELKARVKQEKPTPTVMGRPSTESATTLVSSMFNDLWRAKYFGMIDEYYSYNIEAHGLGGRRICGTPNYKIFLALFASNFTNADFVIEHIQSIDSDAGENEKFVHARWSVTGEHVSGGFLGEGTGCPLYVLGISHFRVVNGRIAEEWVVFDELALWQQIKIAKLRNKE